MLPAVPAPIDLTEAVRQAPCGSFEPEVNIMQIQEADRLFDWKELGLSQAQRLVVIAFLKVANVGQACGLVGVPPTAHRRWLKDSEGYQEAFQAAFGVVVDRVEGRAFEMAMNGNADMIKLLLKGRRREVYGEKVEHMGEVNVVHSWAELAKRAGEVIDGEYTVSEEDPDDVTDEGPGPTTSAAVTYPEQFGPSPVEEVKL